MKIIPKLQNGAPVWYNNRYGNRTYLQGWKGLRQDYANTNLILNGHYNAGSLDEAFRRNLAYTNTPAAIGSDILTFYNTNGNNMSAEEYEKFYNSNAEKIRSHWAVDRVYGTPNQNTQYHNRLFRAMFASRSNLDNNSDYNIGYQEGKTKGGYDMDAVEGSSTWLRRMDLYENEDENDPNRIHTITLGNGKTARYYKMANGNIKLLPEPSPNNPPSASIQSVENSTASIEGVPTPDKPAPPPSFWSRLQEVGAKYGPGLLSGIRLAGALDANNRIYGAALKGIRPELKLSYNTYRQIVGDEATKLAYYNRGADLISRSSRPFTSDADRLRAYMMEAYKQANELRAQGDLADNLRIRETSDESNLHQWANRLRATEVANANIASINLANALRLNLLSLKEAANWSSINNWLYEKEYRWRKNLEEQEAIDNYINTLTAQNEIEDDPTVNRLNNELAALLKANGNNYNDPNITNKIKEIRRAMLLARIAAMLKYRIAIGRDGLKIVKRDRLLYKTSKDVIDSFIRLSKISSDAQNRKKPKIEKLAPHPKGKIKYQQGGAAPFVVYNPMVSGTETLYGGGRTSSRATSSSSSKSNESKDTLDMLKKLFESVKGLPTDVSAIYADLNNLLAKAQAFGTELSTNDIAGMYSRAMQQLSTVAYYLDEYNLARENVTKNGGLNEFAVTSDGDLLLQDKDSKKVRQGSVEFWANNRDLYTPLTNNLLLNMRAISPQLLFDNNTLDIVNNGVGLSKIAAEIKALAGNIGSSEKKIEGMTEVESNKIKSGINLIMAGTAGMPDGHYSVTTTTKESTEQVKAALNFIEHMLPLNYKAVLDMRSKLQGISPRELILNSLVSGVNTTILLDILPLTGKASDKSESGAKGDSTNSAGLAFVLGQGPRELVTLNTGTSYQITALGIRGILQDHSNKNLGLGATLLEASSTQQGGYFQWNKATFGGSRLNPSAFSHIILNDGSIVGVDLPYTIGLDGNEVPNFLLLRKMEEADLEIRQKNILPNDYLLINQIYLAHSLPPKYDLNGKLMLQNYKRFAIIQATLDENALLNKDAILSDEVALANDTERDLYNESMRKITGDKKFELDDGFLWWGGTKLYKGSIFVPYPEDVAFAAVSSGKPFNSNLPNNASTVLQMLYAPATLNYKPQDVTLSLILNN